MDMDTTLYPRRGRPQGPPPLRGSQSLHCLVRFSQNLTLWQPPRPHITRKRLGLFDTHIWLQHHVCKIVGNATRTLALEAPMERHPDLMYRATTNTQGPHAPCHHGPCFDLATRRTHYQPVAILNATFSRQFRA